MAHRMLALALTLTPLAPAWAGPFSGLTVEGELGVHSTDVTGLSDVGFTSQIFDTGVVGPGLEIELVAQYLLGDFSDVDGSLTVTVNMGAAALPFNGLRFTMPPGAPSLAGATILSSTVAGFDPARLNANDDRVTLNFQGMSAVGTIVIAFTPQGPEMTVSGVCPGQGYAFLSGFTSGGQVAILTSASPGSTTVPRGGCAGTVVDLDRARLLGTFTADVSGSLDLTPHFPRSACGTWVQAVDVATCQTTDAVQLP